MATVDKSQIEVCGVVCNNYQSHPLDQVITEDSPLVHRNVNDHALCCVRLKSRFKRSACLKSKPVLLLLVWSFFISVLQWNYDPYSMIITVSIASSLDFLKVIVSVYAIIAVF